MTPRNGMQFVFHGGTQVHVVTSVGKPSGRTRQTVFFRNINDPAPKRCGASMSLGLWHTRVLIGQIVISEDAP